MARLQLPRPSALDDKQRSMLDAIARGPRGAAGAHDALFGPWLLSPEFGVRAQELGAYVRFCTSLPARLSELAILICARHWMAQYVWRVHSPIARKAGLPAAVLEAVRVGSVMRCDDQADAVVTEFSQQLLQWHNVSDATYARARGVLGASALVELVGILGYYSLVSMTLVTFEIDVEDELAEAMQ